MRLKEVDLVRGFATCWIVGVHFWLVHLLPTVMGYENYAQYLTALGPAASFQKFFPLPFNSLGSFAFNAFNSFFILGYQGVHLFFVLSGFGLTYSRLLQPNRKWSVFIKNKFLKLYPTYWILLLICLILPWLRSELFFGLFNLPDLLRSFFILDKAIPYSWFMFPLIQFYLAFFGLFPILQRTSTITFLGGSLLIKIFYTLTVLVLSDTVFPWLLGEGAYPGYLAVSRLFEFCLGMTFAKLYFESPQILFMYLGKPGTILIALACELNGILGSFKFTNALTIGGVNFPLGISAYDAFIGFGTFVIAFNLARLVLYTSTKLSSFFQLVSKFSYELYLVQFIALHLIATLFPFVIRHEPPLFTLSRAILLYALTLGVGMSIALFLQTLTNFIVKKMIPDLAKNF